MRKKKQQGEHVDMSLATISPDLHEEFRMMLPRLIQLCHPDKHGNSLMSQSATEWLNKMNKIYKRGRRK